MGGQPLAEQICERQCGARGSDSTTATTDSKRCNTLRDNAVSQQLATVTLMQPQVGVAGQDYGVALSRATRERSRVVKSLDSDSVSDSNAAIRDGKQGSAVSSSEVCMEPLAVTATQPQVIASRAALRAAVRAIDSDSNTAASDSKQSRAVSGGEVCAEPLTVTATQPQV